MTKLDSVYLQAENEELRSKLYSMTMEAVRARRWAGALEEENEKLKTERDTAIRKVKNIKLWMKRKGIYNYDDPIATEDMREELKYG